MGFLYSLIDKVFSGSGVSNVTKSGIEPSGHVTSTVNLMDCSMLLMCLWTFPL